MKDFKHSDAEVAFYMLLTTAVVGFGLYLILWQ